MSQASHAVCVLPAQSLNSDDDDLGLAPQQCCYEYMAPMSLYFELHLLSAALRCPSSFPVTFPVVQRIAVDSRTAAAELCGVRVGHSAVLGLPETL